MLRMLDVAWSWTAAVPWRGFETTMTTLRACHAFDTAERFDRLGTRLAMPPVRGDATTVTAARSPKAPLLHNEPTAAQ